MVCRACGKRIKAAAKPVQTQSPAPAQSATTVGEQETSAQQVDENKVPEATKTP